MNAGLEPTGAPLGKTPDSARIESLVAELRRVFAASPDDWSAVDLTMPQLRTMVTIRAGEPMTMSRIATTTGMSLKSASALVDRLVRLGLLSRTGDPGDRRQVLVSVDQQGRDILDQFDRRSTEHLRTTVQRMSPAGRAALIVALEDMLRSHGSGAEPPEGTPR